MLTARQHISAHVIGARRRLLRRRTLIEIPKLINHVSIRTEECDDVVDVRVVGYERCVLSCRGRKALQCRHAEGVCLTQCACVAVRVYAA